MSSVEDVVWAFHGYATPAGNRPVQEWFDSLLIEAQEAALDTLGYLQKLPLRLWSQPEYEHLGDGLSEIRFKDNVHNQTFRIYGLFWPSMPKERERKPGIRYYPSYTFLLGKDKKVKNDEPGKKEARRRMGHIERKEATVHAFKFC